MGSRLVNIPILGRRPVAASREGCPAAISTRLLGPGCILGLGDVCVCDECVGITREGRKDPEVAQCIYMS